LEKGKTRERERKRETARERKKKGDDNFHHHQNNKGNNHHHHQKRMNGAELPKNKQRVSPAKARLSPFLLDDYRIIKNAFRWCLVFCISCI